MIIDEGYHEYPSRESALSLRETYERIPLESLSRQERKAANRLIASKSSDLDFYDELGSIAASGRAGRILRAVFDEEELFLERHMERHRCSRIIARMNREDKDGILSFFLALSEFHFYREYMVLFDLGLSAGTLEKIASKVSGIEDDAWDLLAPALLELPEETWDRVLMALVKDESPLPFLTRCPQMKETFRVCNLWLKRNRQNLACQNRFFEGICRTDMPEEMVISLMTSHPEDSFDPMSVAKSAILGGKKDIVTFLLETRIDMNRQGEALMRFCEENKRSYYCDLIKSRMFGYSLSGSDQLVKTESLPSGGCLSVIFNFTLSQQFLVYTEPSQSQQQPPPMQTVPFSSLDMQTLQNALQIFKSLGGEVHASLQSAPARALSTKKLLSRAP